MFAVKNNTVSFKGMAITSSTQTIILERLEGLALLVASITAYAITAPNWMLFANTPKRTPTSTT